MIWHYGFPKVFIRHYAGTMGFLNKALFGTMYFPYIGVLGRVLSRAQAGVGPDLGRVWARSRSGPSLGPGPVPARAGPVPGPGRDGFGPGLDRAWAGFGLDQYNTPYVGTGVCEIKVDTTFGLVAAPFPPRMSMLTSSVR